MSRSNMEKRYRNKITIRECGVHVYHETAEERQQL